MDQEKFLKDEKYILLLLDELNQHASSQGATDLVEIADRIAGTSRS